jgi:hypothetical protein
MQMRGTLAVIRPITLRGNTFRRQFSCIFSWRIAVLTCVGIAIMRHTLTRISLPGLTISSSRGPKIGLRQTVRPPSRPSPRDNFHQSGDGIYSFILQVTLVVHCCGYSLRLILLISTALFCTHWNIHTHGLYIHSFLGIPRIDFTLFLRVIFWYFEGECSLELIVW